MKVLKKKTEKRQNKKGVEDNKFTIWISVIGKLKG